MLSIKTVYQFSFYLVLTFAFLIGGTLQFLFGLSNTGLTVVLSFVMFLNYVIYMFIKQKVLINWVFISFLLYFLVIVLSSLVNSSILSKSIIYLNFAFLPLSVFYFFYINRIQGYLKPKSYLEFILFIASIQLPVLIIQKFFYDQLITLNNTGQNIASFDFLYGSFLVKSDHSLGCFLLIIIIGLLFNINNINKYIKYRLIISIYLSITLLLAESNISKALLIATWSVYIFSLLYKKIPKSFYNKKFYIFITSLFLIVIFYNLRNIEFVTSRLGGAIEKNYTIEKSSYFFEEATAKRLHILIVAIYKLDPKYLGDGPYSYFNILTGKFKNTIHFSQIIWTYFDLGILGLISIFMYMYNLVRATLKDNKGLFIFIFPITIIYMMYTTPFSEIGILISFFLIFSLKQTQ